MKKETNKKYFDSLTEGIVELILLIILFAVGALVCLCIKSIFSIDLDNLDFDFTILIGIVSLVAIILIFDFVKKLVKNKRKK